MQYRKHIERAALYLVSIPFIFGLIFPLVFADISAEIYHRFCFKLYGLPYVNRWHYIKIDRHKLKYLNIIEKMNCAYCGYANGLLHYISKIAGETEKFWCGIKHNERKGFNHPAHHEKFLPYDDEKSFIDFLKK